MRFQRAVLLSILIIGLATGSSAIAQAVFGSIYGTVTDATGAAIPNASVVVTDTAKGTSVTVQAKKYSKNTGGGASSTPTT